MQNLYVQIGGNILDSTIVHEFPEYIIYYISRETNEEKNEEEWFYFKTELKQYSLVGVISYYNNPLSHYYSCIKKGGIWYLWNDSLIYITTKEDVMSDKNKLIYFYKKD